MSTIYSSEPNTKGKVLLETTKGNLEIELFANESKLAARNFVQLCMEGYYNGNIFHRIVKDFIAQTGDPTGTGEGGECVFGSPFVDEFHSRLSFKARGYVACANLGKPNTNGSQFFFTFGPCPHLNKKHTIFGKISGPSIFNLLDMQNVEIGENDRPVHPPKIVNCVVVDNPFDDIVPREIKKAEAETKVTTLSKPKKRKGVKNLALVSFGDEIKETKDRGGMVPFQPQRKRKKPEPVEQALPNKSPEPGVTKATKTLELEGPVLQGLDQESAVLKTTSKRERETLAKLKAFEATMDDIDVDAW
jgi:peptidyl-prolyl cis-trans isomerase SDCCAG10